MSIWNLNVNCGITFGEDSRLTVGEKVEKLRSHHRAASLRYGHGSVWLSKRDRKSYQ